MTTDATQLDVVIYHNPACATSRNTLALIRNAGVEPHVIEYLKCPPAGELIMRLAKRMAVPLRSLLREKDTPFAELNLGREGLTDREILASIAAYPILLNRPIVITQWGVRLCRPSEVVLGILPLAQTGPFTKEDGEIVIDTDGRLVGALTAKGGL